MEFKESFVNKVEQRIEEIIEDDDFLAYEEKLDELEKLMSIYNSMNNIITQNQQVEMFKQSQDMMKNIDSSKVDMNSILGKFMGK